MSSIIGFTFGSFDLFHYGRVILFKEFKDTCDNLVVAVHAGIHTDKYIQSVDERVGQIWSLRFVDRVVIYETDEELNTIYRRVNPDIHLVEESKHGTQFIGSDGMNVKFISNNPKYTSSGLKSRIIQSEG